MTVPFPEDIPEKKGSVLGGSLLIAGSCIGAGMLALPIQSGLAGYFPSLFMFLVAWGYMTLTGLLLVEINGWFSSQVNLISMVGSTLGKIARGVSWIIYLFLFYSLLVAYITGSGSLLTSFISLKIPYYVGSLFFVLIFAVVVYKGTKCVDHWNRFLMLFKVLSFALLIFLGMKSIDPNLFERVDPKYMVSSLPILIVSFGFHNMVPSLTSYLGGNVKRVRKTVLLGSGFVLLVYLIWQTLVLGIVPMEGAHGLKESYEHGKEASQSLAALLGFTWVTLFAQTLGFFAILTSFLAQALSVVHFLGDGLKIKAEKKGALLLCVLALFPPTLISLLDPTLFFKALNFGGGFCAVILFGILPAMMAWKGRYHLQLFSSYQLKGGKGLLALIFLFSLFVLSYQIITMLSSKA